MRIWIIHQHAIPSHCAGPTRHFDLAKELISRGHEVIIFASNFCHNTFYPIAKSYKTTKKVDIVDGVPFVWIDSPKYFGNSIARLWNMIVFAFRLWQSDFSSLAKPDCIFGSSPSPFAAFAAKKLADRFNVSFIYEIRDLWPETLISLGKFKKNHPFIRLLAVIEKHLLQNAQSIISALPGVIDYLRYKGIPEEKYLWLPNFIALEKIPHSTVIKPNDKVTVMYAGSFNIANDVKTLLKAGEILQKKGWGNRIKIQLVGEGPEKHLLQSWVEEQDLSIIEFLPSVSKIKVFDLLLSADVFVGLVKRKSLYQWGTSLNKMADYMACARPIIFALDSPYDPIKEANAGLSITPENPEQLAKAIIHMAMLTPEERQEIGQNARKYAEAHYNLSPLVDKLESKLGIINRKEE